ncbi:hypothetical protein AOZ06_46725 [Kibdelosporangium phytohabitans]|uniref:Uncharacterized protein n=1 Tax=Kibdelosporangium phytohabitans TaxID=860235 RepID=A0A0N9IF10_9PSEU|nr:hypothetical protein AOZ06_46725 [Kibdelosporangium phytohabitans]
MAMPFSLGTQMVGFGEIDRSHVAVAGGKALVPGLVNADIHKVRASEIVEATIATKQLAVLAAQEGGIREQAVEPRRNGNRR